MHSKKIGLFLSATLCTIALVGCGKSNNVNTSSVIANPPTDIHSNYLSGNCGTRVLKDYATMRDRCARINTVPEGRACRETRQDFLAKYPNIGCNAALLDTVTHREKIVLVSADRIQAQIARLLQRGM